MRGVVRQQFGQLVADLGQVRAWSVHPKLGSGPSTRDWAAMARGVSAGRLSFLGVVGDVLEPLSGLSPDSSQPGIWRCRSRGLRSDVLEIEKSDETDDRGVPSTSMVSILTRSARVHTRHDGRPVGLVCCWSSLTWEDIDLSRHEIPDSLEDSWNAPCWRP